MLTSCMCFRQIDVKALIAYSSVGHMAVVLGSLCVNTPSSMGICLRMIVGHSFVSCSLFRLAHVSSQCAGSRRLYFLKGMRRMYPALGVMWLLGCSCNMGLPPTLGFVREVLFASQL